MENYNQNQPFSDYKVVSSEQKTGAVSKTFMANVFLWMFAGLGLSALFAYLFAYNSSLMSLLYVQTLRGPQMTMLGWIAVLAPLGFVMLMQFGFNKLSANAMALSFIAFSVIMGISLSSILYIYSPRAVVGCFLSASAMFGVMAVMGYTTHKDLTSFGRIMYMGLIGIIIAMVVNFFLHSNALDYLISVIGVAVFTGLTAYDVQKLKRIGAGIEFDGTSAADTKKISIMGALALYLDFINLFLMLLRLFGNRRN